MGILSVVLPFLLSATALAKNDPGFGYTTCVDGNKGADGVVRCPPARICKVNVEICWIRQAFSCANIISSSGVEEHPVLSEMCPRDTKLSDTGVAQALAAAKIVGSDYDLFGSSFSRRALETARAVFPDNATIVTIPFISDLHVPVIDDDTLVSSREKQMRYFCQDLSEGVKCTPKPLAYTTPSGENITLPANEQKIDWTHYDQSLDANPRLFYAWLRDTHFIDSLPKVKQCIPDKVIPGKPAEVTVRVALVSHQHTIMKNFQETLGKGCRTTACWEKKMFGEENPSLGNLGMVCDKGIHLNNDKLGMSIDMSMYRKYDPKGDDVNVVSPGTEAPELFECAANRCFRQEGEVREVIPGLCEYDERTNRLMEWLKEKVPKEAAAGNETEATTDAAANATAQVAHTGDQTEAATEAAADEGTTAEVATAEAADGNEATEEESDSETAETALNEEKSEVRILRKPTVQRQQIL